MPIIDLIFDLLFDNIWILIIILGIVSSLLKGINNNTNKRPEGRTRQQPGNTGSRPWQQPGRPGSARPSSGMPPFGGGVFPKKITVPPAESAGQAYGQPLPPPVPPGSVADD